MQNIDTHNRFQTSLYHIIEAVSEAAEKGEEHLIPYVVADLLSSSKARTDAKLI